MDDRDAGLGSCSRTRWSRVSAGRMGPGPTLLVGPLIFVGVMAVIATVIPPMNESPLAIVLAGLGAMILGVGAWLLIWRQLTT